MGRISNVEKARRASQGAPPPGGAIQDAAPKINPQVQQMTGHASEDEMVSSLPSDTNTEDNASPDKQARRRRKVKTPPPVAPTPEQQLANDPRYQRAIAKATFLGAPKGVKGAFSLAAKIADKPTIALDHNEQEDVDDYFYALSKRRAMFDPFATWWSSLLYFAVMLATLIGTRFAQAQGEQLQKKLAEFFGYGKKGEEVAEEGK